MQSNEQDPRKRGQTAANRDLNACTHETLIIGRCRSCLCAFMQVWSWYAARSAPGNPSLVRSCSLVFELLTLLHFMGHLPSTTLNCHQFLAARDSLYSGVPYQFLSHLTFLCRLVGAWAPVTEHAPWPYRSGIFCLNWIRSTCTNTCLCLLLLLFCFFPMPGCKAEDNP